MFQAVCASVLVAIAALPTACSSPPPPLPHSLYIWQRLWDPPLIAAVGESRAFASSLRVLVLQVDRAGYVATSQDADWEALKEIPYGETATYGDIARRIGRPKAFRAVGSANHSNPISIIVPCHRVIGAGGKLTGYGGGLDVKQKLLELEQKWKDNGEV
jgi:methylated-DNA-[protein]-cysteine S-methyltransferase